MTVPTFTIKFYDRAYAAPKILPGLQLGVAWYDWAAMGGPRLCELTVSGERAALWQVFNILRCPVEIYDDARRLVWAGYIREARVNAGVHSFGATLEDMANRVAVAYVEASPYNGITNNAVTAFASDALSVGDYGTKERIEQGDILSATDAAAARDRILATLKYPAILRDNGNGAGDSASLIAAGWYATLGWNYFSHAASGEAFDGATGTPYLARTALRQSAAFQIGRVATRFSSLAGSDTVYLTEAALNVSLGADLNNGVPSTPDDLLYCDLFNSAGNTPGGSRLARSTGIPLGDIESVYPDITTRLAFPFSTPYALAPATEYWLVLDRSSSLATPYPDTVEVPGYSYCEGSAYTRGRFSWEWPLGTWRTDSPRGGAVSADGWAIPFQASGIVDSVAAIRNAVTGAGQFVSAVLLDTATSGIRVSEKQDGSLTLGHIIETYASAGTSTGARLLVDVTAERRLRVRAEPAASAPVYKMDLGGNLYTLAGAPIPAHFCPCGEWVTLSEVIPPGVGLSTLASPSPFFIESARYDARANALTFEPRGALSPLALGAIV